jgi:hypothetical protein
MAEEFGNKVARQQERLIAKSFPAPQQVNYSIFRKIGLSGVGDSVSIRKL